MLAGEARLSIVDVLRSFTGLALYERRLLHWARRNISLLLREVFLTEVRMRAHPVECGISRCAAQSLTLDAVGEQLLTCFLAIIDRRVRTLYSFTFFVLVLLFFHDVNRIGKRFIILYRGRILACLGQLRHRWHNDVPE